MIRWNRSETDCTVKMNELFSTAGSASQVLYVFFSLVFICSFFAVCFSFWFFIVRFGFSTTMLVLVFCCSLLLFVAFRCPFLLILIFHGPWCQPLSIGQELTRTNENGNVECSLSLLIAFCCSFWLLRRVSICCSLLFAALRSSFVFLNQFYVKNQNRQMPSVARFRFL